MISNDDIRFLQELVSIQSVSGEEADISKVIEDEFFSAGLETAVYEVEKDRPLVLGILRGKEEGKVLIYNGHTDTHSVENYIGNPCDAYIHNGKLYGRGSVDMKGGLAAMIRAAKRIKRKGTLHKGTLIVAAVPDEELLSKGTTYLVDLNIKADAGIVGEPTMLKIGCAMRGVTHINIRVDGHPKHTSTQDCNSNAIIQMGYILTMLDQRMSSLYDERKHDILGAPVFNVGLIHGGKKPNVVAESCTVTLLRRDLPGEKIADVLKELEEEAKKVISSACTVSVYVSDIQRRTDRRDRLPLEVPSTNKLVETLRTSIETVTGQEADIGGVPFWCDASIMTNEGNIPTVVFGPGDISCAHSPEEYISIEEYLQSIDIYEKTAVQFLNQ